MSIVAVLAWLSPGCATEAGPFATGVSLSPITSGLAKCHLSLHWCGKREARWWYWDHWTRQPGPRAAQLEAGQRRGFEDGSKDVLWKLCKMFMGSLGSNRLLTMGRGGPCRTPALPLHVCCWWEAKPVLKLLCDVGVAGSHWLLGALIKVWSGLSASVLLKSAAYLHWGLCWH